MIYLDTNVIISYMDEEDPNHEAAVRLLKKLEERRVVSELVLLELATVYSRAGLEKPLPLAIYSIKTVGAEIPRLDLNQVLREALKLAPRLKLKILDLLHIAACKTTGAQKIATFDKDIQAKAETLGKLGIKVLIP